MKTFQELKGRAKELLGRYERRSIESFSEDEKLEIKNWLNNISCSMIIAINNDFLPQQLEDKYKDMISYWHKTNIWKRLGNEEDIQKGNCLLKAILNYSP